MNKKTPVLSDWSLIWTGGVHVAPEARRPSLEGIVWHHARYPDATRIITSEIVGYAGNRAFTQYSTYILRVPSTAYQEWLAENGIVLDLTNPLD